MDKLNKCYIWHIITLAKMKLRLRNLKLRNGLEMMRFGKNTDAATEIKLLKQKLSQKERKITRLEMCFADILLEIRNLNESNNYPDESIKRRKISELCTDVRYELLVRKKESTAPDSESESS